MASFHPFHFCWKFTVRRCFSSTAVIFLFTWTCRWANRGHTFIYGRKGWPRRPRSELRRVDSFWATSTRLRTFFRPASGPSNFLLANIKFSICAGSGFGRIFAPLNAPSGASSLFQDTDVAERQSEEAAAVLHNCNNCRKRVSRWLKLGDDEKAIWTPSGYRTAGSLSVAPTDDPLQKSGQDGDGDEQHHVLFVGRVAVVSHHHQVAQHSDGDDDGEGDAPCDDEETCS